MSVDSVIEKYPDTDAREGVDSAHDTRIYEVLLTGSELTPARARYEAITAPDLPKIGYAHPYDFLKYVQDIQAFPVGGSIYLWEVRVLYASGELSTVGDSDPLKEPPVVAFRGTASVEPIDFDINGDPIVNSANETFDPPLSREFYDTLITIRLNRALYDELTMGKYRGAINSDPFLRYAPGTCRINAIDADVLWYKKKYYYSIYYEIQYRFDGWQKRVLDQGTREYTGEDSNGNPEYEIIKDKNGDPITSLQALDGFGEKLSDNAAPVWLMFNVYRALPFSYLNLEWVFNI